MSGEGAWTPRDVPPEEVVDRCTQCGAPMELVVGPTLILERCQVGHHLSHVQLCVPEAFAEG